MVARPSVERPRLLCFDCAQKEWLPDCHCVCHQMPPLAHDSLCCETPNVKTKWTCHAGQFHEMGCPHTESVNNDTFFQTITHSPQWKQWKQEVNRRLAYHNRRKSKIYTGVWDMTECVELGRISAAHWQDFLKFVIQEAKKMTQSQDNIIDKPEI